MANLYFIDISDDFDEKEPQTKSKIQKVNDQRKTDLAIENVFGPYLIGVGTFINGIGRVLDLSPPRYL